MRISVRQVTVGLCWLCGFGLVGLNLHLARVNRDLGQDMAACRSSFEVPLGTTAPVLRGTEAGHQAAIDFSQMHEPAVVLVFSPTCPVCDENWPAWTHLIQEQSHHRVNVIGVDLSGVAKDDYVMRNGLTAGRVLRGVDPQSILDYRFRFTPQTLVIRGEKVVGVWTGLLTKQALAQAEHLLAQ